MARKAQKVWKARQEWTALTARMVPKARREQTARTVQTEPLARKDQRALLVPLVLPVRLALKATQEQKVIRAIKAIRARLAQVCKLVETSLVMRLCRLR